MAKKRKAYNPMKQLTRVADHLTNNVMIAYLDSFSGCVMLDLKHSRLIPPESREGKQVLAALSRPHKWSCFIACFGRTAVDEYMKSEQIFTSSRYYQDDLAPVFEEKHFDLIKSMPEHHRCGVGWLASPKGIELTEKQAGDIFNKLGAWQ